MNSPQTRTLVSNAQLNRARGRLLYRVVLTLVVLIFTVVFIGPLYFLFSDGLKSTTEAVQVPPTIIPPSGRISCGRCWSSTATTRAGKPLNVGIFEAASTTPQNLVLAASAMAAVPTLIFFLVFQRNILSGLTAGSLKG